jgi:hypothetical protein
MNKAERDEKLINMNKNILELSRKYKNNPYMINKLHNYIVHLLPGYLELNDENHKQREERKQKLITESDKFINLFMGKNKYFYNNQTEFFFLYDGKNYSICNEDDIVYQILTTISQEKSLMPWKHKIKNNIICKIRENSILKSIPESHTIQEVIQLLYPNYFTTKQYTKYFLTIIGDNLLKKNENIIYFISPKIKKLLQEISNKAFTTLGQANVINNLKFKYYDHNYKDCRLITIQDINQYSYNQLNQKYFLNILCVAAHYSERYKSADQFLKTYCDYEMNQYSFYLTNNNSEMIVDDFIQSSLQTSNFVSIAMKNILFLWKKFLEQKNIPNVLFNNPLKQLLKKKLKYNEENDSFTDVTSIQLPIVSNFLNFWEDNINQENEELEYEIDEICTLFKYWSKKEKRSCSINEENMLDLIQHFYPDIVIENQKYILHIGCKLWDKNSDIFNSINNYRENCLLENNIDNQTLYDLYTFYCSEYSNSLWVASKKYFDKYASTYLKAVLNKEQIISQEWFQNTP